MKICENSITWTDSNISDQKIAKQRNWDKKVWIKLIQKINLTLIYKYRTLIQNINLKNSENVEKKLI